MAITAITLQNILDNGDANRVVDALRKIGFGSLLNKVVAGMTYTETGVSATTNVGTLANQPSARPFSVNATTATATGEKIVRQGPVSGTGALVPNAGEVIWDGGKKLLFNVADNVTVFKALYATAADAVVSAVGSAGF